MKVCFAGLGSIGQRHLRNLLDAAKSRGMSLTVDALRHSARPLDTAVRQTLNNIYDHADAMPMDYDVIFITNPTSNHYETLMTLKYKAKAFFIEKPAFAKMEDVSSLPFGTYYVACPLRHSALYASLQEMLTGKDILGCRAVCSSFLPDWRPAQDYRLNYSAIRSLGGGVDLDLVHEWDYVTALLGFPKQVYKAGGKFSALEIDTPDMAAYIGVYDNKLLSLHMDYVGRIGKRQAEFYLQNDTLLADFYTSTIRSSQGTLQIDKIDMYVHEMNYFMDLLDGKVQNINTIENALRVLDISLLPNNMAHVE